MNLQYNLFLIDIRLKQFVIKLLIHVFLAFIYIPDWYQTQEMCDKVISEDPFMIAYYPDKYKI